MWRRCGLGANTVKKHTIKIVRIEMDHNDSPGSPKRLNPTRIPKFCPICGAPMTDGGDCDSPFVAPAAVDQLYLVRAGSSQNVER